jgi:hypothetical protein
LQCVWQVFPTLFERLPPGQPSRRHRQKLSPLAQPVASREAYVASMLPPTHQAHVVASMLVHRFSRF